MSPSPQAAAPGGPEVGLFRHTILMPFGFPGLTAAQGSTTFADRATAAGWTSAARPINSSADAAIGYEEALHLPGWAVASLTGQGGASIQIFEGRAVSSATVECWQGAVGAICRYEASLSRLAAYIFDSGLAVVIVELSFATTVRQGETTRSLLLSDVETLLDRLGRLYAGRYEAGEPVEVPDDVRWTPPPAGVARFSQEDALRWLETHGQPPLADHWRELLGGGVAGMSGSLVPVPLLNGPRTPFLAVVGLADPTVLTADDWTRLALADEPGSWNRPYGEAVFAELERQAAIDFYWSPDDPQRNTRYFVTAEGVLGVGRLSPDGKDRFATMSVPRFSGLYLQLVLFRHMQRASILYLTGRLDRLIARYSSDQDMGRFQDAAHALRFEVLRFSQRRWLEPIGVQRLTKAMDVKLMKELDLVGRFDRLSAQVAELDNFVAGQESLNATLASQRLNRLVALSMVTATVTGFFGMNFFEPQSLLPVWAAVSCAVTAGTVGLLAAVFYAPSRRHRRPDSPGLGIWLLVACVLLLAGMALWLTVKDWHPLPGG